MAYNGISPYLYKNSVSAVDVLDDISGSFDGSTTAFNITVGGAPYTRLTARACLIVLGGIVQEAGLDYYISNGQLVFTTAPQSGLSFEGRHLFGLSAVETPVAGSVSPSSLSTGGPSWDASGNVTISGNTYLGDNDKLYLGTGNDLEIYHSGNESIISDIGTGPLYIRGSNSINLQHHSNGEFYAKFNENGAVELYHDNSKKLETTTSGVTLTGELRTDELLIKEINSTKSDTAVDVFVYDTSKDSDGGAWRKRTQHTSWYNETLNTSTRGSRREFPAVAVIVAESQKVTIYDGDDPDLPMWMVFNRSSSSSSGSWTFLGGSPDSVLTSVSTINGFLVVGVSQTSGSGFAATVILNFLSETISMRYVNGSISTSNSAFVYRNLVQSFTATSSGAIINGLTNDVAMTVLPNAPIDPSTGLPIPTIAVATNGGVSVIKDDGTVVDITFGGQTDYVNKVIFDSNNNLAFTWDSNDPPLKWLFFREVPVTDVDVTFPSIDTLDGFGLWSGATYNATTIPIGSKNEFVGDIVDGAFGTIANSATGNVTSGKGVFKYSRNYSDFSKSIFNNITSTYNTGWMHGNIKGAFLSDTDATNVTATELVTNGTFTSDTSGWTAGFNASLSVSSSQLVITNGPTTSGTNYGIAAQSITTVIGKSYVFSAKFISGSVATTGQIRVGTYLGDSSLGFKSGTGTIFVTFKATSTTTWIGLLNPSNVGSATITFDDASVRLADPDRSVNNKGLQVFGTITKSAVATDAELVAYSGWSSSNYLMQPYNSDLNFGTSDFCVMGWFKLTSNNTQECIIMLENPTGEIDYLLIEQQSNGDIRMQVDVYNGAAVAYHTTQPTGVWIHYCGLKIADRCQLYINGSRSSELDNGFYFNTSFSFDNTSGSLYIGRRTDGTNPFSGQLALWKISSGIPSPEQIKKIYEDEKVLFQENAACTLYGSSDAVTALSYDDTTNLLHVGTSSGRSDFQGLRRINNTTTAVTTAISASNGLIAEQ